MADSAIKCSESTLVGKRQVLPSENRLHKIFEEALARSSEKDRNREALRYKTKSLTFEELNQASNRLARALLTHTDLKNLKGRPPLVALCLNPSEKLIITLMAILKSGAAYVPLDTTFPTDRIVHILQNACPVAVVYSGQVPTPLSEALTYMAEWNKDQKFLCLEYNSILESSAMSTNNLGDEVLCDSSNLACVLYTSGSTGMPKGVQIPHKQLLNRLQWCWNVFPFAQDEICVMNTNITFIDSATSILGSLLKMWPLVVVPRSTTMDAGALIEALEEVAARRVTLVPSMIQQCLLHLESRGKRDVLRCPILWVNSGEQLSKHTWDRFFKVFPKGRMLANFYGSTEVTADATYACYTNMEQDLVDGKPHIGQALDNTNIYLINDELCIVALGEIGEICVTGLSVCPGYLNESVKGHQGKFIPNPFACADQESHALLYRTGDYGRIVDGVLAYEGRMDSQVKIRGQRIDLSEVELAMHMVDEIDKAVVLRRRPKGREEAMKIIGFYKLRQGMNMTFSELVGKLKKRLSAAMMPLPFPVDCIPFLHNGKVDRQRLLTLFDAVNENTEEPFCEEDNQIARILLKAVGDVTGIRCNHLLNLNNNYFDIGGDSLNTMCLIAELHRSGLELQLGSLVTSRSLRDLLPLIQSATDSINSTDNAVMLMEELGNNCYETRPLDHLPKEEAIQLIARSFACLGQLEIYNGATFEAYHALLLQMWQKLLDADCSFGVMNECGELMAVSLNCDFHDEPKMALPIILEPIFHFLDEVERNFHTDPRFSDPGVHTMHAIMMATAVTLTPNQNLKIIKFMEGENIQVAKRKGYHFIITTNTNALTRDICRDVFGYEILLTTFPCKFVSQNGVCPFSEASPDYFVDVACKKIDN